MELPNTDWLWNDRRFIKKRRDEQDDYIKSLQNMIGKVSEQRITELYTPAVEIWWKFQKRLEELDALRTKEERG